MKWGWRAREERHRDIHLTNVSEIERKSLITYSADKMLHSLCVFVFCYYIWKDTVGVLTVCITITESVWASYEWKTECVMCSVSEMWWSVLLFFWQPPKIKVFNSTSCIQKLKEYKLTVSNWHRSIIEYYFCQVRTSDWKTSNHESIPHHSITTIDCIWTWTNHDVTRRFPEELCSGSRHFGSAGLCLSVSQSYNA